ncbi:hypothetical protein [Deinococcus humi]|uniref:SH3 domain-containing protein n=1 Tax=Deinococcus humi TaxID=662880 RepID=A0A7W8ND23_9DEIO|nr:hypothetical protein [Deinococcus humi]MBB5361921.1 hypothetical protein [Deinococcus humi]GGO22972.1 hypothetical protein GCM10008949_10730 [Deinococcus humi]
MPADQTAARFRRLPALLLLGSLAWAAAQGSGSPSYYPHTPGRHWTYSNGETQVVGPAVTHRGVRVVPISHQFGGKTFTQDLLEFRADGSVWLRGVHAGGRLGWYPAPLNVYPPAPLTPGQRWTSVSGTLKSSSAVTGVAAIDTAGGKYNALSIRTETSVGGQISVQTVYLVPGLGVVRYETADGSRIDLLR